MGISPKKGFIMNKYLMGTSALVAAAAFAAPALSAERIQLQLRGYNTSGISYTDSDYDAGYIITKSTSARARKSISLAPQR
jgi:hypothetical protein